MVKVGSTYAYGSDVSLAVPNRLSSYAGNQQILGVMPLLIFVAFLVGAGVLGTMGVKKMRSDDNDAVVILGIGLAMFAVALLLYPVCMDAITNLLNGNW